MSKQIYDPISDPLQVHSTSLTCQILTKFFHKWQGGDMSGQGKIHVKIAYV